MPDIIIVSLPGTLTQLPFAAPALLKASIQSAGLTCKTIDFNIRFYRTVPKEKIQELENFFSTGVNVESMELAEKIVNQWADEILGYNPRYVGISVFTYQNRTATKLLCKFL